jgi:hypothetical protein
MKIAHLLPVADGALLAGAVGLRVVWDEMQSLEEKDEDVQTVCLQNARLWKEDLGPIPPRMGGLGRCAVAARSLVKSFKYDSSSCAVAGAGKKGSKGVGADAEAGVHVNDKSSRGSKPKGVYPQVQLLQRLGGTWRTLKTLSPLAPSVDADAGAGASARAGASAAASGGKTEMLESCELRVTVDASTGALGLAQTRGSTVSESRTALVRKAGLIFMLLMPFMLLGLFYSYTYLNAWYLTRQHTAWLTDFYTKHAPEKLSDPAYVARTVHKYRGKMFLLWRGLERTYEVKWPAPHSILDSTGATMTSEL